MGSKNDLHNNYQDFERSWRPAGRSASSTTRCFMARTCSIRSWCAWKMVPMLVVKQGEVAVIKAYVGLPTADTSGADFKFGSIVRPGHRGIWQEPLRTGKYAINPRCYEAENVPTSILSLNWAEAVSTAHKLDEHLSQIVAKSREGFVFTIELVVQIHVPDTRGAARSSAWSARCQPGQRGAASGGGQPLPRQDCRACRRSSSSRPAAGAASALDAHPHAPDRSTKWKPAACTSRT